MKKIFLKWLAVSTIFVITACSTNHNHTANKSKPVTKYKISDKDVKAWIVERNRAQQCLFPKGSAHIAETQPFLYQMATYNRPLVQVLGEENYLALSKDASSQQYLAAKLRKFNHTKKADFITVWCNDLRQEYSTLVKLANVQATKANKPAINTKKPSAKSKIKVTRNTKKPPVQPEQNMEESILNEEIRSQDTYDTDYNSDEHIRLNTEPFKSETIHF